MVVVVRERACLPKNAFEQTNDIQCNVNPLSANTEKWSADSTLRSIQIWRWMFIHLTLIWLVLWWLGQSKVISPLFPSFFTLLLRIHPLLSSASLLWCSGTKNAFLPIFDPLAGLTLAHCKLKCTTNFWLVRSDHTSKITFSTSHTISHSFSCWFSRILIFSLPDKNHNDSYGGSTFFKLLCSDMKKLQTLNFPEPQVLK